MDVTLLLLDRPGEEYLRKLAEDKVPAYMRQEELIKNHGYSFSRRIDFQIIKKSKQLSCWGPQLRAPFLGDSQHAALGSWTQLVSRGRRQKVSLDLILFPVLKRNVHHFYELPGEVVWS